ncbi:lysozyme inhibitor LprI family protein [Aquimarina algiphila]|uniref:lysozyme inhibitor LprI family protein n=1 Tax=Aquimarina algiphila TaxID=2047982 RepID=UPI0024917AF0|nr:lysozyme inhibitor LprI family protein [Aquimarina algiphila]
MRIVLLLTLLITCLNNCWSQNLRSITKEDSIKIKTKIKDSLTSLKNTLERKYENSFLEKNQLIEFTLDTTKIELKTLWRLEIDYSTASMVDSAIYSNKKYDELLNKYYKILLNRLDEEDKKILRQSQRKWIEFRDDEIKLIVRLSKEKYSGGGSIQRVIVAGNISELTKKRVIDLYQYSLGVNEY